MLRKKKPVMVAAFAATFLAFVFWVVWSEYKSFLQQGQRPPAEALLLNQIEATGLPVTTFQVLSGEEISLKEFSGKLIILNFWASWCDPCVAEFPSLLKLLERYKGRIELVAISGDYAEEDIHSFLKVFKVKNPNLHVVWDKDLQIAKKFGTYKLPESYIINTSGKFIRKVSGVDDWSSRDAFEYFDHLLSMDR